jgi:hypothetical protein
MTHLPLPVSLKPNSISNSYFGTSVPGSIKSVIIILALFFSSFLGLVIVFVPSISITVGTEVEEMVSGESDRINRQCPKWRPLPRIDGRRSGTTSDGLNLLVVIFEERGDDLLVGRKKRDDSPVWVESKETMIRYWNKSASS